MTSTTSFGPDQPISKLRADVKACVTGNTSTEACDEIMGGLASNQGWCADPNNATQTYCACVNAPSTGYNAACFFSPCVNNAFAYQNQNQRNGVLKCPTNAVICNEIISITGSDNIVSGVTMECGIITKVTNVIKASPYLAVLLFVLILTLVMVIAMKPDDSAMGGPLPPDLVMSLTGLS